jgi:hypothetical protein
MHDIRILGSRAFIKLDIVNHPCGIIGNHNGCKTKSEKPCVGFLCWISGLKPAIHGLNPPPASFSPTGYRELGKLLRLPAAVLSFAEGQADRGGKNALVRLVPMLNSVRRRT